MKLNSDTFKVGGRAATYVLVICSLLQLVNYMDRQVMGVVLVPVMKEFGLSDSEGGLLTTILMVGVIIFVFPVAHMVDRWSRKKMIALLAVSWSLFTFLTGIVSSYALLLATRFFVGIGEAGFSPASTALISSSYPEQTRAQKLSIYAMFITVGSIVGVVLGGFLSAGFGWRIPFLYFAVPGVILGILALFMQDYKTRVDSTGTAQTVGFWEGVRRLASVPSLRWLWIGNGLYTGFIYAVVVWMPALLMRTYGFGKDRAGLVLGIIAVIGLVGVPLGGVLADRMQKRTLKGRIFFSSASILAAAVILLLGLASMSNAGGQSISALTWILLSLYGFTNTMAMAPLIATTQDVVTPELKGRSYGLMMLAQNVLGGAWSTLAVGAMSDAFGGGANGLSLALAITAVAALASLVFWWFASRHCPADIRAAKSAAAAVQ